MLRVMKRCVMLRVMKMCVIDLGKGILGILACQRLEHRACLTKMCVICLFGENVCDLPVFGPARCSVLLIDSIICVR